MKHACFIRLSLALLLIFAVAGCTRFSAEPELSTTAVSRSGTPTHAQLQAALPKVVAEKNGGFDLQMWATVMGRGGRVKAVAFSGSKVGDQWLGSRAISAVKANTANAFSLSNLALSTANLYSATQPGGSLYGLHFTNPVDPKVVYGGKRKFYGTTNDYIVDKKPGGINTFGGGLALYNSAGKFVGALGVSGDSSCADHNIAWKLRDALNLDYVPLGVSATGDDNIVYDINKKGESKSGWGHPRCSPAATKIGKALPESHPVGTVAAADLATSSAKAARVQAVENLRRGLKKLDAR